MKIKSKVNYHLSVLPNKIRVVSAPLKDRKSVSIGIWVHAGGRDERPDLSGISHFLEHLVFKGTSKRTANQIKEQVEGVGGTLNAFTSEECTCFLAKTTPKHTEEVFDVLSDMVLNASLKEADIEKERTVVMEEIKMTQDQPSELAEELFTELVWTGHALGRPVAGTLKTVSGLSRNDIQNYRNSFYAPEFITVAASGALDHQTLVKLTHNYLSGKPSPAHKKKMDFFKSSQEKPRFRLLSKPTKQTQIVLGVHSFPKDHPQEYTLDILSVLLGGNMSSRLFNKVREERGLAYDIGTSTRKFQDTGAFVITAGVDTRKAAEAIEVVLKELVKVSRRPVSTGELERAKEFYLGQLDLGLENTMNHMLWVGDSVVSGGALRTHEAVTRHVQAVSKKDIRRVAKHIFETGFLNLVAVGPKTHALEKKLSKLLKM